MSPTIYPERRQAPADELDAGRHDTAEPAQPTAEPLPTYRGSTSDPVFGFILATALSIGLIPLPPELIDLRFTVAWLALAIVGVLDWLLGSLERIGQEKPENIAWGIGFGLLISLPFMIFYETLQGASRLIFSDLSAGTLLAYLVFVAPLAETLFFRGVMQRQTPFWMVGLLAAGWSVILFFPAMWGAVVAAPAVAIFLTLTLIVINLMYSYVRMRNSLAAAWLCQITAGLILFFVPFL